MFKREKKQYHLGVIDLDNDERIYLSYKGQIHIFDNFINLKKFINGDNSNSIRQREVND